ncbi:MAG: thermonuclease family protein [Actinobacteria bacterium]|nr:thermonuclease family protein [Actinomycetota bacterium]MCB9388064.1 thermonuclease family protein [Acidimicrobiia bacterium]
MTPMRVVATLIVAAAIMGWVVAIGRGDPLQNDKPVIGRIEVHVVGVADGDTIDVEFRGHVSTVRLLGIDTPETHHPNKPVQCFGPEASAWTTSTLMGATVELEFDQQRRDVYDRLLAWVWLDGELVNTTLVKLGYARLLLIPPNLAHGRALLTALESAQGRQAGLWASCESR